MPGATITDAEGNRWKPTFGGTWRRLTPQEEVAEETGAGQAFFAQAGRSAGMYQDIASLIFPTRPGMQDQARASMAEREQRFAPLDAAQGGPSIAGGIALDPLDMATGGGLAVGGGRLLARRAAGRMSRRVAARTAAAAARLAATDAATSSVGAAAVGDDLARAALSDEQGFIGRMVRAPQRMFDDMRRAADELLSVEDLTPDQRQMIPVGEQMGFRFLPGQREGAQVVRELASRDPLIMATFAPDMAANRRSLRQAAARAIGANVDDFSRDVLGQQADALGEVFQNIGERIGPVQLSDDLVARIDLIKKTEPFLPIDQSRVVTGGQLMQLRSSLDAASRQAWLAGANARAGQAQYIDDIVLELDDLAESALDDASRQAWRTAQQRWKNLKVLESPNVVNELGEINHRSLSSRLRQYYKGAYGRQVTGDTGRRAGLLPETREFMDWSRLAAQFGDNFPNSGTPYGNRLIQLMTNPKEMAKSMMLRQLLESRLAERAL